MIVPVGGVTGVCGPASDALSRLMVGAAEKLVGAITNIAPKPARAALTCAAVRG